MFLLGGGLDGLEDGEQLALGVAGIEGGGFALVGVLPGGGGFCTGLREGLGEPGDVGGGDVLAGKGGGAAGVGDGREDVLGEGDVFELGFVELAARLGLGGGGG